MSVKLNIPQKKVFFFENMWSCRITNSGRAPVEVTLYGWITKKVDEVDKEIGHGRSNIITIQPGVKMVTAADIKDVTDYWYESEYEPIARTRAALPAGDYTICIQVERASNREVLAKDCIEISVGGKIAPPKLMTPRDGDTIRVDYPTFTWTPAIMIPSGGAIEYDIKIVEVPKGETKEGAMESNRLLLEETGVKVTSFTYPASAETLKAGNSYAWQVYAHSAGNPALPSDIWTFTMKKPSAPVAVNQMKCYYELSKEYSNSYVEVPNDTLNVQFINDYASADKIVMNLYDIESQKIVVPKGSAIIIPKRPVANHNTDRNTGSGDVVYNLNGLNRISINLRNYGLHPGKLYLLKVSDFKSDYTLTFKVGEKL